MTLVLTVLAFISLLELTLWLRPVWKHRITLATILVPAQGAATAALLAIELDVMTVIFAIFSLFRVINLFRVISSRIQADFLYKATRKSSLWLIFYQLIIFGINRLGEISNVNMLIWFYLVAVAQLCAAGVILASTLRHLKTTRAPFLEKNIPSRDLPTLTVAIPARNETRDLEECLRSLVQNNYPKLEILVLDDNSQEKRTPEIIRGFAQQGVRFLQGKVPPNDWLPKNYAYQQLAEEANGEILLFCGVDTRFSIDSLNSLITDMVHKNKNMMSVMPLNLDYHPLSLLLQPARYAWELSLPRRLLRRPPVLSTCWLIRREAFIAAGGFKAVSRKVVPESYFAKQTAEHADGYSFMRSDNAIGLFSQKTPKEQFATAIRTRYPQLHRRPELVALTMMAQFVILFWPLVTAILAALNSEWVLAALNAVSLILVAASYAAVSYLAFGRHLVAGALLLPVAALFDLFVLGHSMWQYEFGEVRWKGRDVSPPVMRAVSALPKIG